jgi:hypothetical protein
MDKTSFDDLPELVFWRKFINTHLAHVAGEISSIFGSFDADQPGPITHVENQKLTDACLLVDVLRRGISEINREVQ